MHQDIAVTGEDHCRILGSVQLKIYLPTIFARDENLVISNMVEREGS